MGYLLDMFYFIVIFSFSYVVVVDCGVCVIFIDLFILYVYGRLSKL